MAEHLEHSDWPPRDKDGVIISDIGWWAFCRVCTARHRLYKAEKQDAEASC